MKSHFVIDLADGQAVSSLFLVREKEIRTSVRTGNSWLQLELADRTGSISAKMWDNFADLASTFERDDVVQIRGRVKLYNGQKEVTLEQIIPAVEHEYDLGDFLPHTKCNVEELYATVLSFIAGMKNPWLKRLLSDVVEDPAIAPRFKRAPAAVTMHHAYIGGLIEHVVSLIGLARLVAAHYPELDEDLLLAGIVLHDMGKIEELHYARAFEYSDSGRLLGHITIGTGIVRDKIAAIPGFPPRLATLVLHLILSHHGSYEFGSPSLPQIPEAVALHFCDDLDSKMGAMRATLCEPAEGVRIEMWTDRNPALRRALLRSKRFLEEDGSVEAAAPAVTTRAEPQHGPQATRSADPVAPVQKTFPNT